MISILLDSSVLIAASLQGDLFFRESAQLVQKLLIPGNKIVLTLPRLVMVETIVNIYKHTKDEYRTKWVGEIAQQRENTLIVELDQLIQNTAEILLPKVSLKTSDLIIATSAYITKSTLITWDTKLIKEASKICEALTPKQFLKKMPK
jgi:predicted nucleic acid-binding protein